MTEEHNEQRDTVVVNDQGKGTEPHNTGVVVALIVLVIVLLLIFFGRGLFDGGSGDDNIDINTPAPTTTETQ